MLGPFAVLALVLLYTEGIIGLSPRCNDSALLSSYFNAMSGDHSRCPAESWIINMFTDDIPKSTGIYINIGFNKGYNFATWIQALMPGSSITAKEWHQKLISFTYSNDTAITPSLSNHLCGACRDCYNNFKFSDNNNVTTSKSIRRDFVFIGVDLNAPNVELVDKVFHSLQNQLPFGFKLYLHSMAASNETKPLRIPNCLSSDERCKIPDQRDPLVGGLSNDQYTAKYGINSFRIVPMSTVDELFRNFTMSDSFRQHSSVLRHNVNRSLSHSFHRRSTTAGNSLINSNKQAVAAIDILMIDTEGNDALVLQGASRLIRMNAIRCIIFEYNEMSPWIHMKLRDSVRDLDTHGYECFFQGQDRLWPISGSCWHDNYETHKWSNIMCIRRGDSWMKSIRSYIVNLPFIDQLKREHIERYEGKPLGVVNSKDIYWLRNGTLQLFYDAEAYLEHFEWKDAQSVGFVIFLMFPQAADYLVYSKKYLEKMKLLKVNKIKV